MDKTTEQQNNKRIAKNTLLLYIRTMFTMAISLFSSRVILETLGVEDYGIYSVVGGVVAMFSVISGALSSSISRFLTFEIGKKSPTEQLRNVFSTGINIQLGISVITLLLGEIIGIWFLNNKMNIPIDRLNAANWALQCSLLTFIVGLLSIPYNAAIIAYEKMSAFAYISILEALLKLVVVFLLYVSPIDKLVFYVVLLLVVALIIRTTYVLYCTRNFEITHYKLIWDKGLLKQMTGFAVWNFFTNSAYIFNTQGVNILINIFFGVGVNAARGIAVQMETAIKKFVMDFTTAINPQIIKNYAAGNMDAMHKLICRGSKFSFLLMFCMSLPFLFETPTVLKLWLNKAPEHTVTFFRLAIICTMIDLLGNTGYTACMATGNIKKYVMAVTSAGCLVFPLTWGGYAMGMPVEACYIIFAFIYLLVDIIRLFLMKSMVGFPPGLFIKQVCSRIFLVSVAAVIVPIIIVNLVESSLTRFVLNGILCVASAIVSSYFLGLDSNERDYVRELLLKKLKR